MAQEQKDDSTKEFAIIVGVGPGLGRGLAVKFASNGLNIVLVSRSGRSSTPIKEEINANYSNVIVECLSVDTSDDVKVKEEYENLIKTKGDSLGVCGVLCYNAGPHFKPKPLLKTSIDEFNTALKVGVTGALIWSQAVLPSMQARNKGTILLTGATAALRGSANCAELAAPKFALRALSQSMAREFQPKGIHVAHIIVDGFIWGPKIEEMQSQIQDVSKRKTKDDCMDPEDMAQMYYNLYAQKKNSWTQELDLRPFCETF